DQSSADGFAGTTDHEIRSTDGVRYVAHVTWSSDASGDAFEVDAGYSLIAGEKTRKLEVQTHRGAGKSEIQITVESAGETRWAVAATRENFVAEPLEDAVLQQFARTDAGRQMVVQQASSLAGRPHAVIVRTDAVSEGGTRRIWEQHDYDASRQLSVLDKNGEVERIGLADGVDLVRTDRTKLRRSLPWYQPD